MGKFLHTPIIPYLNLISKVHHARHGRFHFACILRKAIETMKVSVNIESTSAARRKTVKLMAFPTNCSVHPVSACDSAG